MPKHPSTSTHHPPQRVSIFSRVLCHLANLVRDAPHLSPQRLRRACRARSRRGSDGRHLGNIGTAHKGFIPVQWLDSLLVFCMILVKLVAISSLSMEYVCGLLP
jgi:hypothetical protein